MVNRNGLLLVAVSVLTTASSLNADEGWYATYEEARNAAEAAGVPLLVHFHASYCGPCRQMKAQVFSQPAVQRQLRDGLAAVEVDVGQRPDLASRYGASTVPRDVVVYPGRSSETLNVGFKSTLAYLDLLKSVSARGAQIAATKQAVPSTPKSDTAESAPPEKIVGLEGFCPVRLIRDREWVSGRKDISETYRGITYYFSSPQERDAFREAADRFTPENLGCDPVVLFGDQRAVTGKIKYGAFFDSQLYLFESADNRSEFKSNPLRYARIRHAIKVDDLAGQRFN